MSDGRGWSVLHLGQESDSSGCASEQFGHDLSGAVFDEVLYEERAKLKAEERVAEQDLGRAAGSGRGVPRLAEL